MEGFVPQDPASASTDMCCARAGESRTNLAILFEAGEPSRSLALSLARQAPVVGAVCVAFRWLLIDP